MLPINQLSHITLICKDIDKTGRFLKKIFGAVEYYSTKKNVYSISCEKFFKIGKLWIVIMEGESVTKTYNHIAFQADVEKFEELREEIKNLGLNILEGRKRVAEEGDSIYFYDYDNHLFELHSGDLDKRLNYYQASDSVE
jgi:fosfomycin resistance protein FosX